MRIGITSFRLVLHQIHLQCASNHFRHKPVPYVVFFLDSVTLAFGFILRCVNDTSAECTSMRFTAYYSAGERGRKSEKPNNCNNFYHINTTTSGRIQARHVKRLQNYRWRRETAAKQSARHENTHILDEAQVDLVGLILCRSIISRFRPLII